MRSNWELVKENGVEDPGFPIEINRNVDIEIIWGMLTEMFEGI